MALKRRLKNILRIDLKEISLLSILGECGPIGRYRLVNMLNLPEGIVRRLLVRFQGMGYILSHRRGSALTEVGKRELTKRLAAIQVETVKRFDGRTFKIGPVCVAIHMKGLGKKIRCGVEERDNAIKGGAKGAIALLFEHGSLIMPGLCNMSKDRPGEAKRIKSIFNLEENDVILIVFAEDYWKALEGALFTASALKKKSLH